MQNIEDIMSKIAYAANQADKKIQAEENLFIEAFNQLENSPNIIEDEHTYSNEIIPYLSKELIITHKIWVNWSILKNQKLILQKDFFEINHPWGTIYAIEDLTKSISKLTTFPWTITSVFAINP